MRDGLPELSLSAAAAEQAVKHDTACHIFNGSCHSIQVGNGRPATRVLKGRLDRFAGAPTDTCSFVKHRPDDRSRASAGCLSSLPCTCWNDWGIVTVIAACIHRYMRTLQNAQEAEEEEARHQGEELAQTRQVLHSRTLSILTAGGVSLFLFCHAP